MEHHHMYNLHKLNKDIGFYMSVWVYLLNFLV